MRSLRSFPRRCKLVDAMKLRYFSYGVGVVGLLITVAEFNMRSLKSPSLAQPDAIEINQQTASESLSEQQRTINRIVTPAGGFTLSPAETAALNRHNGLPITFDVSPVEGNVRTPIQVTISGVKIDERNLAGAVGEGDSQTLKNLLNEIEKENRLFVELEVAGASSAPQRRNQVEDGSARWIVSASAKGEYRGIFNAEIDSPIMINTSLSQSAQTVDIKVLSPWITADSIKSAAVGFIGPSCTLQALLVWWGQRRKRKKGSGKKDDPNA
jgi:hypothetical protein